MGKVSNLFSQFIILSFSLLLFSDCYAIRTAPVSGFAMVYPSRDPIAHATITILENGTKIKTNKEGKFGPIDWPVGKPITLVLEKKGYHTTQSATVTVPKEGLTDSQHNMTFQVPSELTFYMLAAITHGVPKKEFCHVAATIIEKGKTLYDAPQGIEHAKAVITPETTEIPFYFGIFKKGPLKDGTNPFVHGLTDTSFDGGVVYFNLTPMETPYTMTATKDGVAFTKAQFICRKGMFINLSPPQGPSVV